MVTIAFARQMKLVVLLAGMLAVTACAKKPVSDVNASGVNRAGLNPNAAGAVPGSPRHFALSAGDRIFFETDSSELTPAAQATLAKQARWLNRFSHYQIKIEGHADERGTRAYNFALGARRANVTKNYLIARGVSGSRIRTTSFGKERPVAVCDNISCWSQNRRAQTIPGGQGRS